MNTKKRHPRVSIIMPTLNSGNYIGEAIQSLANQTYENIELIIVDGGSTDQTIQQARDYSDQFQRMEILVNDPSVNQSFARNRGLMHAKGEYIVFHDSDDISFPSRFKDQVSFLTSHSDVGAVGSSFYYLNPNRGEETIRVRPTQHDVIRESLGRACPIHIGSAMVRREALKETHLFRSEYAEFYEILIDLAAKGWRLRNLDDPLFVYRLNDDSISRESELEQKKILVKRSYQAVTRLDLPFIYFISSLGWFFYMYSPARMKRVLRWVFTSTNDKQLDATEKQRLRDLIESCQEV